LKWLHKTCKNPLGAKNNDSTSEKQAIVKFYTMEYRKCGNSNSKNDSRLWVGASTFLKSVYFRAFAVNVKTIAPKKYLYQFGHAIWWNKEPMIIRTFLESYNLKGKKIVPFCTSGGSGITGSMKGVKAAAKGAKVVKGKDLTDASYKSVEKWAKKKVK